MSCRLNGLRADAKVLPDSSPPAEGKKYLRAAWLRNFIAAETRRPADPCPQSRRYFAKAHILLDEFLHSGPRMLKRDVQADRHRIAMQGHDSVIQAVQVSPRVIVLPSTKFEILQKYAVLSISKHRQMKIDTPFAG